MQVDNLKKDEAEYLEEFIEEIQATEKYEDFIEAVKDVHNFLHSPEKFGRLNLRKINLNYEVESTGLDEEGNAIYDPKLIENHQIPGFEHYTTREQEVSDFNELGFYSDSFSDASFLKGQRKENGYSFGYQLMGVSNHSEECLELYPTKHYSYRHIGGHPLRHLVRKALEIMEHPNYPLFAYAYNSIDSGVRNTNQDDHFLTAIRMANIPEHRLEKYLEEKDLVGVLKESRLTLTELPELTKYALYMLWNTKEKEPIPFPKFDESEKEKKLLRPENSNHGEMSQEYIKEYRNYSLTEFYIKYHLLDIKVKDEFKTTEGVQKAMNAFHSKKFYKPRKEAYDIEARKEGEDLVKSAADFSRKFSFSKDNIISILGEAVSPEEWLYNESSQKFVNQNEKEARTGKENGNWDYPAASQTSNILNYFTIPERIFAPIPKEYALEIAEIFSKHRDETGEDFAPNHRIIFKDPETELYEEAYTGIKAMNLDSDLGTVISAKGVAAKLNERLQEAEEKEAPTEDEITIDETLIDDEGIYIGPSLSEAGNVTLIIKKGCTIIEPVSVKELVIHNEGESLSLNTKEYRYGNTRIIPEHQEDFTNNLYVQFENTVEVIDSIKENTQFFSELECPKQKISFKEGATIGTWVDTPNIDFQVCNINLKKGINKLEIGEDLVAKDIDAYGADINVKGDVFVHNINSNNYEVNGSSSASKQFSTGNISVKKDINNFSYCAAKGDILCYQKLSTFEDKRTYERTPFTPEGKPPSRVIDPLSEWNVAPTYKGEIPLSEQRIPTIFSRKSIRAKEVNIPHKTAIVALETQKLQRKNYASKKKEGGWLEAFKNFKAKQF